MPYMDHEWLASYIIVGETAAQTRIGLGSPSRAALRANIHDIAAAFRTLRLSRWSEENGAALNDDGRRMRLWALAQFLGGYLAANLPPYRSENWSLIVGWAMDYAEDYMAELASRTG